METEVDIKEFESRVVKTFCDEYLRKVRFIRADQSQLKDIKSIDQLIKLLMNTRLYGEGFLYKSWIDNTFNGFEESIKTSTLVFKEEERKQYRDNVELKKSKDWLYEVLFELHQKLLKQHRELCGLDGRNADCYSMRHLGLYDDLGDDSEDPYDAIEYKWRCQGSISYEEYKAELIQANKEKTGINNSEDIINKKSLEINDEILKTFYYYFDKRKNKKGEVRYCFESDLTINLKTIPYTIIDNVLKRIAEGSTSHSDYIRGYAKYVFSKGGLSIAEAARQVHLGKNSLKAQAKKQLMQAVYIEIIRDH